MRILVTGANGLLGNHLVRELLADGHEVRALVRKTSNTQSLEGLRISPFVGDVRDEKSVREACEGCDWIFHAAAVFAYSGYDSKDMMSTAREGTSSVLRAARDAKVKRVILTSSSVVVGGSDQARVLDENGQGTHGAAPEYFGMKRVQEEAAIKIARELGVDLAIVNPSLMLGPYDARPSASLALLTAYLSAPLPVANIGGTNVVHVADAARGHILVAQKGAPYERHIVAGENWQTLAIYHELSMLCGLPSPRFIFGPRIAYAGALVMELVSKINNKPPLVTRSLAKQAGRFFWYSADKAEALGFSYRPMRETLLDVCAWLMNSPHLSTKIKGRLRPAPVLVEAMKRYA